ncbi:hypothetical protein C8J57DRAFT_1250103 [Mycena rebaudengoi]|nr:hypothetical protein C8J57DRAFT_1250103 [Mycena rebaudengoi]
MKNGEDPSGTHSDSRSPQRGHVGQYTSKRCRGDSNRENLSADERKEHPEIESARLLRVWISVWSLIGGWLMIHLDGRIRGQYLNKVYKKEENEDHDADTSQPATMPAFSNSNTTSLFVIPPSPPPETYESIRYLARPAMMPQILANEPLDDRSPEQAVRGAVYDQWRQYHGRVLLTIQPTFMAAPQSVYYGATITDSGQSVHTLSNLNGHHIITNPETRLPTLVSGHSFTTIFEVPGHGPWYIEAPYPSEERIQGVLGQYPLAPGSPVVFPDQSTSEPPPLPRLYHLPQARWTIPVAQRPPPPDIAAPVTVATTLALNVTTSSDEMEEIAASLFTGTTASSDEPLATPDYPGTPPPTAQMALSPNPTEPPGSATPSTQTDSLPELIDIDSEEWKSELAIRIEAALVDDVQLKQRQGHDLKADVLETNAGNERAGSFEKGNNAVRCAMCLDSPHPSPSYAVCPAWRAPSPLYSDPQEKPQKPSPKGIIVRQDNGKEVTGGINSKAEREIREWISGKTESEVFPVHALLQQRHEELTKKLKGPTRTESTPSPASHWKEGEEELEIRAWRAAELYKRRVEHHIFAIDTTPYPVINSSDRDTPERPRKPYIVSAETQQLLEDALTADRETTRADQVAVPFLTHGRGAVVTREHWSSSPEVDSSGDSDCGLDDVDPYSHALFHDEFSRPLHRPTAVPPAIVAQSDTIMDSLILPVPTAKKPLITFPMERSRSLFGDSDSELTSESSKTHDTDHFLRTLERVTGQKRRAPPLAKDVALGTWNWVMDLADEQDIDRQKQVDWCLVAFQDAYEIIFGALEPHLDPSIMTAQQGYDYHGTTSLTSERNKNQEGSPPRPDHATTSLDYRLPDTPANGTQHAGSSGDKRKRAVSQDKGNARFRKSRSGSRLLRDVLYAETLKATGYANPETIAQLAEARAALKQGLRRTRQLALDQHFNVLENVPMEWERTYHSLLTDDEVDKLRVLQLACAYEEQHQLAGLIHHLLQVRFRHEYALGHLLGAGFLDLPQGEKESSELWEVLDGSDIDWNVSVVTAPAASELPERPIKRAKGKRAARQSEDQGQYFTGSPWESTIWDASAHDHDNPGDDEHMGISL